jgi:protein arginine N-methyltransferase 3
MVSSGKGDIGIPTRADIADDKYLQPVLTNDAVLFSLDDLPEANATTKQEAMNSTENDVNGGESSIKRVRELEEELGRLQAQFLDYRLAVKKSLDARWNDQDSTLLSVGATEEKRDDDSHYFSSYSFNGIPPLGHFFP